MGGLGGVGNRPQKEMSCLALAGASKRNVLQMGFKDADSPLRTDLGDPALPPHPRYQFRNRVHQVSLRSRCYEQLGLSLLASLFDVTMEVFPSGEFGVAPLYCLDVSTQVCI